MSDDKPIKLPKIFKRERTPRLHIVAWILLPLVRLMFKVVPHGHEKLPKKGAYVLVGNHLTNVDPLAVAYFGYFILRRAPHFLAKEALFRVPIVGFALRMGGQIPVFRGGGPKNDDSLRLAHEFLKAGHTINIFPEGTLTREPNLWPMRGKSGAVRLALETDVPVYAIAHWGAEKILPRYGSKFRPGFWKHVDILVGDEIDLSPYRGHQLSSAELTEATDLVMTKITELVERLRGEKAPAARYNPAHTGQSVTGNFVKAEKAAAATASKSAAAAAKASKASGK